MRTKSEARRRAILDAAAAVFRDLGFERASMADICERVGFSKATLYSYFESKEELFFDVVMEATAAEFEAVHVALQSDEADITRALRLFGARLLALLYSPPVQAVRRLVVSQAGRGGLGPRSFELGPARSEQAVAEFLARAMADGRLRPADPHIAALHLRALLEAEWLDRFMFQLITSAPDEAQAVPPVVERAVAVFMAAYGPLPAA